MDYFTELMRIADTMPDGPDKSIVQAAAVRLAPVQKPSYEKTTHVSGWGVQHIKVFDMNGSRGEGGEK
jgi:hypothetical protein